MSRCAGRRSSYAPRCRIVASWVCLLAVLVMGHLGLTAGPASAAPGGAALSVQSVDISGAGQIVLLGPKELENGRVMPFADPGTTPLSNPVWTADGRNIPAAFVRGSRPRFGVDVRVNGGLPAGVQVTLIGHDRERPGEAITTPAFALASGAPDESLRFELELAAPVFDGVTRTVLEFDWLARIDGDDREATIGRTSTLVLVTHGMPIGGAVGDRGGVSYRRLAYLTALAAGRTAPAEIVSALGTALTAPLRYNLYKGLDAPGIEGEPFAVLDGLDADCRTLSMLMERAIGLLGLPGARVAYIFPRTGSWRGLSSDDPGASQHAEIQIDLFGTMERATLYFDDNGPNRYHACCVWTATDPSTEERTEQWWIGGKGTRWASDFDVFLAVALPNRPGRARQYYVDGLLDSRPTLDDGPVPFPGLPKSVWSRPLDRVLSAIREAGYEDVVVVNRPTLFGWMTGRVRACYAPDAPPGMPVSPHERVVVEVYQD